ncbi:hypothetical protein NBRC10512_003846 [Rhodotorula toruloides]|uniref:RHTO0S02e04566g1_1 n=2 Tax=Rhodotorula toruloides TaxID=5286 RepID=A0A061AGE6_RHOTO|nr:cytochrome b5 type b (outer mitochondrial membrane) [Rhodotorula toruloides NP11]EMS21953.1 cytochrome b5 type b (outer mitochondrial membrane) [Rhodotorula toruloides NP11]KAK4333233.1 Cytochrome b5 [Rhodotorula toruloides]CDR36616.1 RHTO0S02e04566g1_1 [Rhodotorula toruloides]
MSAPKVYTWDELKSDEAKSKSGILMLIHGKVYAISKFLDEHPGGDEVLFGEVGRDATEAFEDVGHSDEAREILKKYYVGEGPEGTASAASGAKAPRDAAGGKATESSGGFTYLLPLAFLAAYFAYKFYSQQNAA